MHTEVVIRLKQHIFSPYRLVVPVIFQLFKAVTNNKRKVLSSSGKPLLFKAQLKSCWFRSLDVFPGALPLVSSTRSLSSSLLYPSILSFIFVYFERFLRSCSVGRRNVIWWKYCLYICGRHYNHKHIALFSQTEKEVMLPLEALTCKIVRCI